MKRPEKYFCDGCEKEVIHVDCGNMRFILQTPWDCGKIVHLCSLECLKYFVNNDDNFYDGVLMTDEEIKAHARVLLKVAEEDSK